MADNLRNILEECYGFKVVGNKLPTLPATIAAGHRLSFCLIEAGRVIRWGKLFVEKKNLLLKLENNMIDHPYIISKKGTEGPLNLGVGASAYLYAGDAFHDGPIAASWTKNKKPIIYRSPGSINEINPYPTPDMEYMVVIKYGPWSGARSNAVLVNDEGEEIFTLDLPKRLAKEKWAPKNCGLEYFKWCSWCKDPDMMEFVAAIGETDWVEFRYWNYKTRQWDEEKYTLARL